MRNREGYEFGETLAEAFVLAAERTDIRLHFWEGPGDFEAFGYDELAKGAEEVAGALQHAGLKPGERVAIVLPTAPSFYHAFFGVILAGAVPSALYPPVRFGRFREWQVRTAQMLQAIGAEAVLTERRMFGLLGKPVDMAAPRLGCHTVAALRAQGRRCTPVNRQHKDLAVIQFSSGSTGQPKPVGLSHENMLSNALSILHLMPRPYGEQTGLSWLPLYHDMGLIGTLLLGLIAPATGSLLRPEAFIARPKLWLQGMSEVKATGGVAPNFAFGLCAKRIRDEDIAGIDLSSWRYALCGAEPLHRASLDAFADRFEPYGFDRRAFTPVYGLAEATLAVSFSELGAGARWHRFDASELEEHGRAVAVPEAGRELCSLGRPLADVAHGGAEIAIMNDAGQPLPEDRLGRVMLRGQGIMMGYFGQPDATATTIRDGWLDTGDQGFLHHGELFLYGRRKDIIIIRGRNFDPAIIEQAADAVPSVRSGCSAAVGIADPKQGTEQLLLLVESRADDLAATVSQAQRAVRAATGLDPVIDVLEPGTLPRTSSGKIRRHAARQLWLDNQLRSPASGGALTVLKQSVLGLAHQLRARVKAQR